MPVVERPPWVSTVGFLIALVVLIVAILGLIGVVPGEHGTVFWGVVAALALARLL